MTLLTFGMHKGKEIESVPTDYLDWLIGQEWLDLWLKQDIIAELKTRPDWENLGITHDDTDICPKCVSELSKDGYCKICQIYPLKKK